MTKHFSYTCNSPVGGKTKYQQVFALGGGESIIATCLAWFVPIYRARVEGVSVDRWHMAVGEREGEAEEAEGVLRYLEREWEI